VTVLGAGSIGTAFALTFAAAGIGVRLWDPVPEALTAAIPSIRAKADSLAAHHLLDQPVGAVMGRIVATASLEDAVADADLVQECAPERLDLKRDLFAQAERFCPPSAIVASSSSAIPPSEQAAHLARPERLIVAHPGNPPYLLRVIELVPSPATAAAVMDQADRLYRAAGFAPIRLTREVEGFVFNRLQGALLREAYCLVRDGVASVDDVDRCVREGLGMRWAFIGPFETADVNTRGGIESHAAKLGPAYQRMGAERGQGDPWTDDLVAEVTAQRRALLPLDAWEDRVAWRDEQLMKLRQVKDARQ
jgi:3-hydroxyacyl-CoA dehydrogenase